MKYSSEKDVPLFNLNADTAENAAVETRRNEDRSEAFRAQWNADIEEANSDARSQISHADVVAKSRARWAADLEEEAKSKPSNSRKSQ